MAQCNFQYIAALLKAHPNWEIGVFAETADGPDFQGKLYHTPYPVEATVRFKYPPDLGKAPFGHTIMMQPWEYGACPRAWVEAVNGPLTELWAPTTFVRDCFIKSGANPNKVFVVPHGIDPEAMKPEGRKAVLPTDKGFRFLFVGGLIVRKGSDLLLAAYEQEFGPDEDVCLVVKPFGTHSLYRGQGNEAAYRAAAADPNKPEILVHEGEFTREAMADLYRACDAMAHPFRGEGYGLPIAEAMACGLPTIVTNYGAPLDFTSADTSYLVEATTQEISTHRLQEFDLVGAPYWAEPDITSLRKQMRHVFEDRSEANALGMRAAEHMHANHTWDRATQVVAERLLSLPEAEKAQFSFPEAVTILSHDLESRHKIGLDSAVVEKALASYPGDPALIAAKARALTSAGDWDGAFSVLSGALGGSPDNPSLVGQLCWMQAHKQQEHEAWQTALSGIAAGNDDFRFVAGLSALYGHYVCIGKAKWAKKPDRQEAKARAERLKSYLSPLGWDYKSVEPLGTKLSLSMIVKNEEKYLAQCLESVKGIVNEIVIVDTGSSDRTVEIALAFGAKVFHFDWTDDFSEARNESLKHCTGDWVLWLDADEALEPSSVGPLREALVRPQFGAYLLQIVNFMKDGSTSEVFTHHPCRLFRRLPATSFEGVIHEQVLQSIGSAGLLSANLAGARILHYGYASAAMSEKNKLERTMRLVQKELDAEPDSPFHNFNLGNTYYVMGDYQSAAEVFARCADRIEKAQDYCATTYHLWASALVNLKRPEEALAACERADARGILAPAIEFSRATSLYILDRYEESLIAAARAREIPWEDQTTGDFTVTTFKLEFVEGQSLLALGRIDEAINKLEKCLAGSPDYVQGRYYLGLAYARAERYSEAIRLMESLYSDDKLGEPSLMMASEIHSRTGNVAKACQIAGRLAVSRPDDEELWRKWLALAEQAQDWTEINAAYSLRAGEHDISSDMFINWGRACASLQDWGQALQHFQGAIEADPSNANAFLNAGDTLYKLGAYPEAADAYQTALRVDPSSADGWFVLGNSLYQMGMYDGAKIAFEQALDLRPVFADAKSNLALVQDAIRATAA